MLAWSEGTDNGRQKTRNHGYDVIVGRELFTDYLDHPRKLVTLNPKLKSTGAGRYQLLSRWWDAYRKQLGLKDFSPKVRTLWHCSRLRSVALFTYDWSWWYPSGKYDRCSNIWASLPGAGYGQFEHKADSLIAKFKEAGGTVREIVDVWAESPRLSPLWLSASSSACHGLLIITVITPLPTKPSATKMPENWSWRTRQLLTCRCVNDVAALDAKYTKELADAKAENDALRDDVAAGHPSGCIKAVCQSVRGKPPPPPAWIMQPPPDWQTPLNRIISPQRRGWSLCKNNWKEPEVY